MSSMSDQAGSSRDLERSRRGVAAAAALALVVSGASVAADDVYLDNGRVFEEVVATLTDTHVVIEMDYGRMRLPRSQVIRVDEKKTPLETFRERRALLLADSSSPSSAWAELARWAWAHGLERDAAETALLAARLDPEVEDLDAILTQRGFERDAELGWVPRAVAMERRGLVDYGGEWITPEQRAARIEREREAREELAARRAEERGRDEPKRETESERGPTSNEVALASIELAREVNAGRVGISLGRTSSLSALHPVFVPYLPLSGGGGFWTGGGGDGATTPGVGHRGRVSADWEALANRIPGSRLPLSTFRQDPPKEAAPP